MEIGWILQADIYRLEQVFMFAGSDAERGAIRTRLEAKRSQLAQLSSDGRKMAARDWATPMSKPVMSHAS